MVSPVTAAAGFLLLLLLLSEGEAEPVQEGYGAQGYGQGPYGDPTTQGELPFEHPPPMPARAQPQPQPQRGRAWSRTR